MNRRSMVREKTRKRNVFSRGEDELFSLILHNDDFNLFEYVIISLIEVCGHEMEQAEQCTLIAHLKGKCEIMKGKKSMLIGYMKKLTERNLTVTIE